MKLAQDATLVFIGAGIGAVLRWFVGLYIHGNWPVNTFIVNSVGSFAIGVMASVIARNTGSYSFWVIGLLGGFTTFSSFSLEFQRLVTDRGIAAALGYAALTNLSCLLLCALGTTLVPKGVA